MRKKLIKVSARNRAIADKTQAVAQVCGGPPLGSPVKTKYSRCACRIKSARVEWASIKWASVCGTPPMGRSMSAEYFAYGLGLVRQETLT